MLVVGIDDEFLYNNLRVNHHNLHGMGTFRRDVEVD